MEYLKEYNKKLALITGGSSGIGFSIARHLIQAGSDVFIIARRLENLTSSILDLKNSKVHSSQRVGLISADVSREGTITPILQKFITKVGAPDYVFNSAGIVIPGTVTELTHQDYQLLLNINFLGTVNVIKAILPSMCERKAGHIINISSFAGFFPSYGYSAYGASKFAVRGYTDVLRSELKEFNINVSIVYPADTDTPQLRRERLQQSDLMKQINSTAGMMSADEVAISILKGVARRRYVITPGFESSFAWFIANVAGYMLNPIMDHVVRSSRKKIKSKRQ